MLRRGLQERRPCSTRHSGMCRKRRLAGSADVVLTGSQSVEQVAKRSTMALLVGVAGVASTTVRALVVIGAVNGAVIGVLV